MFSVMCRPFVRDLRATLPKTRGESRVSAGLQHVPSFGGLSLLQRRVVVLQEMIRELLPQVQRRDSKKTPLDGLDGWDAVWAADLCGGWRCFLFWSEPELSRTF